MVAVGEIGYDSMTPEEDEAFAAQLALAVAHDLPALVHTPHRDKARGVERSLDVVAESGIDPGRVVVDHLNEVTVALVRGHRLLDGLLHLPRHQDVAAADGGAAAASTAPERMLVNSAADWGRSDPLLTRATGEAMLAAGFTDDDVDRVLWRNPVEFYGQSGRLDLDGDGRPASRRSPATRSCAGVADAAAALRRAAPSTSATAPTCTPPRTSPASSPSSTRYAVPIRETLGARRARPRAVAGRPGRRRAGRRRRPPAAGCAAS